MIKTPGPEAAAMNVLVIDTSSDLLDVALYTAQARSFELTIRDGLKHTERLLPVVSLLLD
jgi:tRNA A37 threonylcarbamoyladenosine modification protein TsaB